MKKLCLSLALVFGTISLANVEASEFDPGLYFGIDLGYAIVKDQAQETADLMVITLGGRATVTQDAGEEVARILAGLKLIENLDLEVAYFKTSESNANVVGRTGNGAPYRFKVTGSDSGFDYSLLLRPSLSTGLNGLFFRAGGHSIESKGKVTTLIYNTEIGSESVTVKGKGYLLGMGYDESIGEHFAIRGEFTRYSSSFEESDGYKNLFHIALIGKF